MVANDEFNHTESQKSIVMKKKNNILFLTLRVFSATGGIEKVCRVAGKALYENSITNDSRVEVYSMYDHKKDVYHNNYFPNEIFKGFKEKKIKFILSSFWNARNSFWL